VLLAATQLYAGPDKAHNRRQAQEAIERAGGDGAGLVVLPEASMFGFGTPSTDLRAAAEALDGPFVSALVESAGRAGTVVVAGTFEPAAGARVHNTVVIVDGNGVLGRYRKLHLYDALGWRESDRVEPGEAGEDDFVVIKVADLHVGVMTCFDLRFLEMARVLCDRGADVLCVPAAWVAGPHKAEVWGDLCRARAIENTSYVVAGAQPAPEFAGCAMVVDPLGVTLASLGAADVGAHALGEASAEKLAEVRAALPLLASRRFDVVPR